MILESRTSVGADRGHSASNTATRTVPENSATNLHRGRGPALNQARLRLDDRQVKTAKKTEISTLLNQFAACLEFVCAANMSQNDSALSACPASG